MNPRLAGMPGQALERAGEQVSQAAGAEVQLADRMQRAQDSVLLLDAENKIQADIEQADSGLSTWTDFTKADDLKQSMAKSLTDKYSEQFSKDPRLWRYVEPYIGRELNQFNARVDVKRAKLISDYGDAALSESLARDSHMVSNATSIEERQKYEQHAMGQIQALEDAGTMTHVQAQAARSSFFKTNEQSQITRLTRSMNPDDVMKGIELLQNSENFPHIPVSEQSGYLMAAYRWQDRLTNMVSKAQLNKAESDATTALQAKYPGDYDTQLAMLTGSNAKTAGDQQEHLKWLQSVGLADASGVKNMAAIRAVRTSITAAQSDASQQATQASNKAVKEITDAMALHQWGHARQLLKQNLPVLQKGQGETLDKAIFERSKRTDSDISNFEDAQEYLKIKKMDPGDPKAIEKEIVSSPNLKSSTRDRLVDWLDRMHNTTIKSGISSGDKLLQIMVAPTRDMFTLPSADNQLRLADAKQSLQMWVTEQTKMANEGKRKPLTEQEIYQKALEIGPLYQKSMAQQLQDMQNELAGQTSGPSPRDKAIQELKKRGKTVNEDTIKQAIQIMGGQ